MPQHAKSTIASEVVELHSMADKRNFVKTNTVKDEVSSTANEGGSEVQKP